MTRRVAGGLLVVFEGIDGAGKTTQCEMLAARLGSDGWDVARLREPSDGPYGRRIRALAQSGRESISLQEELELFLADRRENVCGRIRPALDRGAIVILDRYYYSTIAYQGARGLDPGEIRRRNEAFAPPADVLLYLALPAHASGERIEGGRGAKRDLFEKEDYLRQVAAQFDAMTDGQLVRIDATQVPEAVFRQVWSAVSAALTARGGAQS